MTDPRKEGGEVDDVVYIDGDLRRDDPDVALEAFEFGMRAPIDDCAANGETDPRVLRSLADAVQTFAIGPWFAGYCRGLRLVADVRSAQADS